MAWVPCGNRARLQAHIVVLCELHAQRRQKTTASQARWLVHSTFRRPCDDLVCVTGTYPRLGRTLA